MPSLDFLPCCDECCGDDEAPVECDAACPSKSRHSIQLPRSFASLNALAQTLPPPGPSPASGNAVPRPSGARSTSGCTERHTAGARGPHRPKRRASVSACLPAAHRAAQVKHSLLPISRPRPVSPGSGDTHSLALRRLSSAIEDFHNLLTSRPTQPLTPPSLNPP
ncbi:hypothetical protein C7M84_024828 [Penaeus vannamei]|uniref:Uncharacterized protein n=1 Tax=Penaeus vannamei TaxID=6689 RepID=A0A423TZX1_PENVA|nr:hypothetical protein C7M84_024828 [Penaeus vannamei]